MPSSKKHRSRAIGEQVNIDTRWARGDDPARVLARRPGKYSHPADDSIDYLIEWATREREWIPEHLCHDLKWEPTTGDGCVCGRVAWAYQTETPI
jgi:hypothetical protein